MADSRDDEVPEVKAETSDTSERQKDFTRRALLRAGWVVPAVTAINIPRPPRRARRPTTMSTAMHRIWTTSSFTPTSIWIRRRRADHSDHATPASTRRAHRRRIRRAAHRRAAFRRAAHRRAAPDTPPHTDAPHDRPCRCAAHRRAAHRHAAAHRRPAHRHAATHRRAAHRHAAAHRRPACGHAGTRPTMRMRRRISTVMETPTPIMAITPTRMAMTLSMTTPTPGIPITSMMRSIGITATPPPTLITTTSPARAIWIALLSTHRTRTTGMCAIAITTTTAIPPRTTTTWMCPTSIIWIPAIAITRIRRIRITLIFPTRMGPFTTTTPTQCTSTRTVTAPPHADAHGDEHEDQARAVAHTDLSLHTDEFHADASHVDFHGDSGRLGTAACRYPRRFDRYARVTASSACEPLRNVL